MTLIAEAALDPVWGPASALFSEDRAYRYVLTRVWDRDLPVTAFVMLNPSTADAFQVDPTVRRCLGFARDWGSGGLVVLNAFALRSTDPKALYGHRDPTGPDNDECLMAALERYQPAQVIAGWGHHAGKVAADGVTRRKCPPEHRRFWVSREHNLVAMLGDRLLALKVTKDGHPGHPLYIAGDTRPTRYYGGPA